MASNRLMTRCAAAYVRKQVLKQFQISTMERRECAGGPLTGDDKVGGSMNLVVWEQEGLRAILTANPASLTEFQKPL